MSCHGIRKKTLTDMTYPKGLIELKVLH